MTYTTEQIADMCNLSKRTVQRCVAKMILSDTGEDMVLIQKNDKGHNVYLITDAGFDFICLKYGCKTEKDDLQEVRSCDERSAGSVTGGPEPQSQYLTVAIENEYLSFLKEQIKEKDVQIQKLMEQNSNLQAILQTYQIKMLPSQKIPWYKRIFGSRKDFD